MIRIRPMKKDDIGAVVAIERSCFSAEAWSVDSFSYRIDESNCFVSLIAELDCEIVGFVCVNRIEDINIDNIAVRKDMRRRGIARALIESVLSGFCGTAFLEVRESNFAARSLYESLGFTGIAVRPDYYQDPCEDAIIMEKEIH